MFTIEEIARVGSFPSELLLPLAAGDLDLLPWILADLDLLLCVLCDFDLTSECAFECFSFFDGSVGDLVRLAI